MNILRIAALTVLTTFASTVMAHGTGHVDGAASRASATQPSPAAPATRPALPLVSLDAPQRGDRKADIVIVEYADYQCPYCRRFHLEQLPILKTRFVDTGVAQYLFKDLPLRQHPEALPAAVFAHCAGEQGKYWQMQDLLFRDQAQLGEKLYEQLTRRLSLDAKAMRTCRADPSMRYPVAQAAAEAARLGLQTTPTILLARRQGDQAVVVRVAAGLPDFDALVNEIESMRKGATSTPATPASQPSGR